ICAWGALAVGAVATPLNAWEPGPVLAQMVADSGAKVVVADAERAERLAGLDVPLLVTRGDGPLRLADILGEAEGYHRLPATPAPDPGLSPDDEATLFFTSGTTGRAKAAAGTHRNVVTNLVNTGFRAARAAVRRGAAPPAVSTARRAQLLPLPFFH